MLGASACDFSTCCGDPAADNYDGASEFLVAGCDYGDGAPAVESTGCDLPFACNFGATDEPCEFESCAGCTEETACNYDADATLPITCLYPEDEFGVDFVDCDGACLNDTNGNGLCDEIEPTGCTDPMACNLDSEASFDDGSCEYASCGGCTLEGACNYDAAATINDGSCEYLTCSGCMDAAACNYDETATIENGTCIFAQPEYDCDGNCLEDTDGDGICNAFDEPVFGCLDATACNYDSLATDDDGSCDFCSCFITTSDEPGYGVEVEVYAENGIPGYTTYRLYATVASADDFVSAVTGLAGTELEVSTTGTFYQNAIGGATPSVVTDVLLGFVPDLAYDSWVTVGLDMKASAAMGEEDAAVVSGVFPSWTVPFENGGNILVNDGTGGGWYVLNSATNGLAGDDQRVLLGQFTTDGDLSGSMRIQVFPGGDLNADLRYVASFGAPNCGCTDPDALNPDADAAYDDGSCQYPGCTDATADNFDADADVDDGSCVYSGCTDPAADNYDPQATIFDGTCLFYGCTDPLAGNFDPLANANDGSCDYAGCTSPSAANYNPTATVDDGSCLFEGCTDPTAANYEPGANSDDGSCLFPGCTNPAADNFDNGANLDNGSCVISGCTDATADNYDAAANNEDGSCVYLGCTDAEADNYDAGANSDDGSCLFGGCTQMGACN